MKRSNSPEPSRRRQRRQLALQAVSLATTLCILPVAPVLADGNASPGWLRFTEENNNLGSDNDRYYVNGLDVGYLSQPLSASGNWASRSSKSIEDALPFIFPAQGQRDQHFDWTVIGQQMYTPSDKNRSVPDPDDRPYAGWLFTGIALQQDTDARRLDDLSVTVGLVGPDSFARQTQNGFHRIFGYGSANGWSHQLHDEPALTLSYAHLWRFSTQPIANGLTADAIPEVGATVGNVFDYVEGGGLVRLGWGLDADYGPPVMQPGIAGGTYFNPGRTGRPWGLYGFGGFQGRLVGHDLFLDGSSFRDSPSVEKYPWVHDFVAGVTFYTRHAVRIDFVYIARSEEFHGQAEGERYGSVTLSAAW